MYRLPIQVAGVMLATFVTTYPAVAWEWFVRFAGFQNFLPVKFAFFSALFFFGVPWYQKISRGRSLGILDGVPLEELLDHLFLYRTFKRDEIEKKFWISRSAYSKLAERLDKHGLFIRGGNNERVFKDDVTREYATSLLSPPPQEAAVKFLDRVISLLDAIKPPASPKETDWKPMKLGE